MRIIIITVVIFTTVFDDGFGDLKPKGVVGLSTLDVADFLA